MPLNSLAQKDVGAGPVDPDATFRAPLVAIDDRAGTLEDIGQGVSDRVGHGGV